MRARIDSKLQQKANECERVLVVTLPIFMAKWRRNPVLLLS
jgi:hypothetical protein